MTDYINFVEKLLKVIKNVTVIVEVVCVINMYVFNLKLNS